MHQNFFYTRALKLQQPKNLLFTFCICITSINFNQSVNLGSLCDCNFVNKFVSTFNKEQKKSVRTENIKKQNKLVSRLRALFLSRNILSLVQQQNSDQEKKPFLKFSFFEVLQDLQASMWSLWQHVIFFKLIFYEFLKFLS